VKSACIGSFFVLIECFTSLIVTWQPQCGEGDWCLGIFTAFLPQTI